MKTCHELPQIKQKQNNFFKKEAKITENTEGTLAQ